MDALDDCIDVKYGSRAINSPKSEYAPSFSKRENWIIIIVKIDLV